MKISAKAFRSATSALKGLGSAIRYTVDGYALNASTTDLSTWIEIREAFDIEPSDSEPLDSILVLEPSRAQGLADLNADLEFKIEGRKVTIVTGQSSFIVWVPEESPEAPRLESPESINVKDLGRALRAVIPATAKRAVGSSLQGINLSPDAIASTDGHRLHVVRTPGAPKPCIVPSDWVKNIRGDGDGLVQIDDARHVLYRSQNRSVTGICLDGAFPNWRNFAVKAHPCLIANRMELILALNALVAITEAKEIELAIEDGQIVMSTAQGQIAVKGSGGSREPRRACLQPGFLHEALTSWTDEMVEIGVNGVVTVSSRDDVFLAVIALVDSKANTKAS